MTVASSPATDRNQLLTLLDTERDRFRALAAAVPVEKRTLRPTPESWSVLDLVEHLYRVDTGVTRLVSARTAEPAFASAEEIEAAQAAAEKIPIVRDRGRRIEAPERVRPTGALPASQALEQLDACRAGLRAAVLAAPDEVLDRCVHLHPAVGPLTLRGWVAFLAHHDARHTAQLAELAQQLG